MDAKEITDALATVTDSYFNKDIITLGYVKGMTIGKDTLRFSLRLPAPLMPNHDELAQKCQDALKNVADIGKIEIKKDWEVQRLPSLNAPNTPNSLKGVKNIIAIASGKGGVGKSTVTVCIAEAFVKAGAKVGILDIDVYGPSIPNMVGLGDHQLGGSQQGILEPVEAHGMKIMSMGFLANKDTPVVWRGPIASQLVQQFLGAVDWGDLDYLFSSYFIRFKMLKSVLVKFRDVFRLNTFPYRSLNIFLRFFLDDLELYTKQIGAGGMIQEEKLKYRKYFDIEDDYDDYWYFRKHWRPELSYRNRLRYLDFKTYMHESVLTKVDRTSMSVSLEARVPLLSRDLIEFMFSLPDNLVFNKDELKGLAKYAYKNILPPVILSKKKQGFSVSPEALKPNISFGVNILKKYYSHFLINI